MTDVNKEVKVDENTTQVETEVKEEVTTENVVQEVGEPLVQEPKVELTLKPEVETRDDGTTVTKIETVVVPETEAKNYDYVSKSEFVEKLKDMGCDVFDLPMSAKGVNPFDDIKLVTSLYRYYRELKPDLIIHYTIKPNIYGSLAAKMAGIPCCKQTFHQAGRHQSIFCKQNELYSRKESYAYQLRMQGHNKGELR